jgi:hypothetical protein
MASLSRVNVQVGFQGQEALTGMKALEGEAKKLEAASKSLDKHAPDTAAKKAKEGQKKSWSWTEFKSQLDLAAGAAQGFVQFTQGVLELGASMQSLQIRMAYLSGSWEESGKALGHLQDLAIDSGISFGELAAGVQKLSTSGLSIQSAVTLMEDFSRGAEILGQGGIEMMAGATQSLLKSATATDGVLQQLQDKGLDVYGALGEELTKLTGVSYTTEEAIRAIRRGAVSSSMAIEAMTAASNSPKALEAQARFLGSFEGQMARLKTVWEELTRDLSRMLLESFNFEQIAAGARGAFGAIRDIAKEIADTFLPVLDPKDKAAGAEKTFRAMREATYDLVERLAKGVSDLRATMESMWALFEAAVNKILNRIKLGAAGIFAGEQIATVDEQEDKIARMRIKAAQDAAGRRNKDIEGFFDGLRAKAGQRDDKRDKELAAAAQGKGAQVAQDAAEAATKMAANLEVARKNMEQMALDLEEKFATPLEQFDRKIADIQTRLLDARGKLPVNDPLLGRVEKGLQRQAGADIMDLIKNNSTGTSWQASRMDRGSSGAIESILRNQFGDQGKNVQERIKAALDRANELAKAQLEAQRLAVEEFKKARPGVIAF